MKFKTYREGDLKSSFEVSYKIDGMPFFVSRSLATFPSLTGPITNSIKIAYSKDDKLLKSLSLFVEREQLPHLAMYELYKDNWSESISLAKSMARNSELDLKYAYRLDELDPRLLVGNCVDPTESYIKAQLASAVAHGYEGLIFRDIANGVRWKVKPVITLDLLVVGMEEGKAGKAYQGKVGALITKYGKVSSGLSHQQRTDMFADPSTVVGHIIEITIPSITSKGRIRHGVFKRIRDDKNTENLEGLALNAR